jgi:hypothetical protein
VLSANEIFPDVFTFKFVEDVVIFESEPAVCTMLPLKLFEAPSKVVDIEKMPLKI